MLATLGYIVPEYFKFPVTSASLGRKFADVPSGIAAVSRVPIEGLAAVRPLWATWRASASARTRS
eukprot:7795905-Heterocapsa_arctica.AAC.1